MIQPASYIEPANGSRTGDTSTRSGASGSFTVGVDLGGTSTRVGLYDEAMQLVASHAMPTRVSAGPAACVTEIASAIHTLCAAHLALATSKVIGIGIGSPGPINLRTGVLGLLPNLPGWDNFPLRDALTVATGLPVILESDANAAAIAEWKLGACRTSGIESMAMLTLGTGLGSGLILGGRIWHGMFGMGGEVGHATVDPEGPACGCGSRGCLEMYASAKGLLRLALTAAESPGTTDAFQSLVDRPAGFTPHQLAELAATDTTARQVFARMGHFLGIGIANILNTLDLPMIVVGGGIASSWPLFAPAMFQAVRSYSVVYRLTTPAQLDGQQQDQTYICPSVLGPSAGLLGASLLPRLALLPSPADSSSLSSETLA